MTRRFVILTHDWPTPHFDFMVEEASALRTWRLSQRPAPGLEVVVEEIAPHRLAYLDYEGPVSGERGTVTRWDYGTCILSDSSEALLKCELTGRKIQGSLKILTRGGKTWLDCGELTTTQAAS